MKEAKFNIGKEITLHFPTLLFSKIFNNETLEFQDVTCKIKGEGLNDFSSVIEGKVSLFNENHLPSPLIPDPLNIQLISKLSFDNKKGIEIPSSRLKITNSITQIQIDAALKSQHLLSLTSPLYIEYDLSPEVVHLLEHVLEKKLPQLQHSTQIQFNIDRTEVDLNTVHLSNLSLKGNVQIKKIVLKDKTGDFPTFENIIVSWIFDAPKNHIQTNLKGVAYTEKEKRQSPISSSLQLWWKPGLFDIAHMQSEVHLNFSGMPTSMLNVLFGSPNLTPLIGPILDLNFKGFIDFGGEKAGYWDMAIDSTNFHTDLRFKFIDQISISDPNKPPTVRLTITPSSFEYIKNLMGLQTKRHLSTPFTATVVVPQIQLPIQKKWMDDGTADLKFFTTEVKWEDSTLDPWKFEGNLSTKQLKESLNFNLKVDAPSSLTLKGTLSHLFDESLQFRDWKEIKIKGELNGEALTPKFIESMIPLNSDQLPLKALIGDSLTINGQIEEENLTGSIKLSLKSTQGHLSLDGKLEKGLLTLNKALDGSIQLTPSFVKAFLTPHSSLLSSINGSENPLTFSIDPKQFSCLLIPFQLEQLNIEKGQFNLGKIHFRNEGELKSILGMIKSLSTPTITIWFTPIYFNFHRGNLALKRFDFLVGETYPLANWGSFNLLTNRGDFVLGLTSQTLQTVFGVKGLNNDYLLQIPIHLANGKTEVDKKKAMARVSSLIAQTHGGEKVKLLGNILDMVLSEKGDASPAPTTQPFPWEK